MADLILGRYQPIEKAGEGGFGTVIVAWDTRIRRKVAIKCIQLRESYATDSGETINISSATKKIDKKSDSKNNAQVGEVWAEDLPGLAEARTAAMIQDANIVTVYDFELANNTAYIIMEYVEGQTLSHFLTLHSQDLTLDMLTCIFAGVSHAISVAHSENVLHLDIKPDNVLIDNKGKVKVTDFGLATLADEFGYGKADAGTIGYMPPEQMRQQNLDVRTDQWSLASIVYEMLAGANPFDAKDIKGSLNNIYDRELACPSQFWDDLDENVDDIVFNALCPEMSGRYVSVSAFAEQLTPYLGNARSGQKQISELIRADAGAISQDNSEEDSSEISFMEKITSKISSKIFSRVIAVFLCVFACWASICDCDFFSSSILNFTPNIFAWIVFGLCGLGACAFPFIGVAIAFILLAVTYILSGQIAAGIAGIVITIGWILFSVYKKEMSYSSANTTMSFVLSNYFSYGALSSILTGIFCKPLQALVNSAYGAFMCLVLPIIASGDYFDAGSWVVFASWVLASITVSGCFQLKKRAVSISGCFAGFIIIIAGILLSNFFASSMISWQPTGEQILPAVVSFIIAAITAFFLPNRK